MSRLLVAQRALTAPGWAKDALWRRAQAIPLLDLRFADNKSLVDAVTGASLVTFARASSGTFVNSAGVLQTAATDAPRFDHNPTTGESLGLLVEEQRTNSIRNNTGVGAVAGTPGTVPTNWNDISTFNGLNRQIVGVGTQNGIAYIDIRYSGTATAAVSTTVQPELGTVTVAAIGQLWTASTWIALVGGSTTGVATTQRITGRTAAGGFLEFTGTAMSLSSTLTRYAASITMANASTLRVSSDIDITAIAAGAAIDITLRIGLPQLEQGAFATSVIPTTTAAATRSASLGDLISSAIANNIRSFYVEFSSPAVGTRGVVSLNDNTANERINALTSGTDPRLVVHDGGVEQVNINGGTVAAGTKTCVAVRINTDDFAISINGATVVTDTSGTLPTVDRLMLGRTQAGEYLNGRIARFTGWTGLLPNATLQSLTQ